MASDIRDTVKTYFQTGDVPTQAQFYEWLDNIRFSDELDEDWIDRFSDLLMTGFDAASASTGLPDENDTTKEALERIVKHLGGMPISLADLFTDAPTSGATLTSLFTYTIPPQTLANDGDKIFFDFGIFFKGSASSKQLVFKIEPATIIADSGVIPVGSDAYLALKGYMIRVNVNTVKIVCMMSAFEVQTFTIDTNGPIQLRVTGQSSGGGSADGDVTAKTGYIQYVPAAN